ncbi:SURF1 family protein [Nocardioides limicola]|uniref:SURF1 family protein n=1 Tax=Nocardioides limicola TaxID=2803368 RepID=UPI00193BB578|nr:SURF1 family protein [Nocardioides sp. DJM-14]
MSAATALKPRYWVLHLVAVAAVAVAGWLGWWQLQAWQAARDVEARDLTLTTPLALGDVLGPDDPFPAEHVGRPVLVAGTWLPDSTLYVSGRQHQGVDGFWAVTPLAVQDPPTDSALLVVRGWGPDRDTMPEPPTGPAAFVAWLQPGEGTGAVDDDPTDDVLPQLRLADAIQHVDQDLYNGYAVLAQQTVPGDWPSTNRGDDALVPATVDQLPQAGGFTGLRNLLYGVEWWVFGAFAAFIWWRWVRDELNPRKDT